MTEDSQGGRQTLAMRLAERQRQRALRAERLARLRAAAPEGGEEVEPGTRIETAPPVSDTSIDAPVAAPDRPEEAPDDAEAALEEFLRALTGGVPATPAPAPEPGAVLNFQRPGAGAAATAVAPGDLDRLPGAGPGLVWALERAGFRRLADLAPLEPADLAARLGPIGRLVPAQAWIDAAKAAAPA